MMDPSLGCIAFLNKIDDPAHQSENENSGRTHSEFLSRKMTYQRVDKIDHYLIPGKLENPKSRQADPFRR